MRSRSSLMIASGYPWAAPRKYRDIPRLPTCEPGGHARQPVPRSLVWATSIDVLPPERVVRREDGYLVVRSPTNPDALLGQPARVRRAAGAPVTASGGRRCSPRRSPTTRGSSHRTFAWDRTDDAPGAVDGEFRARGYDVDPSVGMIASPDEIHPHPRANADVAVKALDPETGGPDERYWQQVLELQAAARDPDSSETEEAHRAFSRVRQAELRTMFRAEARGLVRRHRGDQSSPARWGSSSPAAGARYPGRRHRPHPPRARHLLPAARRRRPPRRGHLRRRPAGHRR